MKQEAYLIGGTWRTSEVLRPVVNPFDGRTVAEVFQASAKEVDEAIGAAEAGL